MKKNWFFGLYLALAVTFVACPTAPSFGINGHFYPDPTTFEACVSGKVEFKPDANVNLTGVEIEYDFGDNTGLLRTSNTRISHVYTKAGTYTPNLKFFQGSSDTAMSANVNYQQIVVLSSKNCPANTTINSVSDYLVKLDNSVGDVSSVAKKIASEVGGSVLFEYHNAIKGFAVQMNNKQAASVGINSNVDQMLVDFELQSTSTQTPVETWGLDRIDQRDLPLSGSYSYDQNGSNVNFYGIDTGILTSHNEFTSRIGNGFDAVNDGRGLEDCNGHGSHTSATVGGTQYGVAKKVIIHPVRVLDCSGSGTLGAVIAGVDWVAGNAIKPAVVNMSLGGQGHAPLLEQAITNTVAKGITFVVAAGNGQGDDACNYTPARLGENGTTITVGATDNTDKLASFSNIGKCVNIFAPGVNILSAWKNSSSDAKSISGTSMAAPHVAGAAALYLSSNPTATPAQVRDALIANATNGKVIGLDSLSPNKLLFVSASSSGGGNVSVTIAPGDQTMQVGEKRSFVANVTGSSNTDVSWEYGSGGSDSSGNNLTYTAPTTPGVYYLKATSVADQSKSATVHITVQSAVSGVGVSIDPRTAILQSGAKQAFTATVTGSSNTSILWEYSGGGTSGSGNTVNFTAPNTPGVYTLKATSVADRTKSASAIITVTSAPATQVQVTITPSLANLHGGEKQTFIATVTGTSNTDISWNFGGLPAGTKVVQTRSARQSNTTEFTVVAPTNVTDNYQLTAISLADPSKTAQALIHIAP